METEQLVRTFTQIAKSKGKAAAVQALAEMFDPDAKWERTWDQVILALVDAVAHNYGLTLGDLSVYRGVRDEAVYVARADGRASTTSFRRLARLLGADHASLVRGQRWFKARMAEDEALRARMERVCAKQETTAGEERAA